MTAQLLASTQLRQENSMDTHNWNTVQGNKFSRCPNSEMLADKGELLPQKIGVKGETKFNERRSVKLIRRDRSYVIAWLAKRFFKNFPGYKWNELQPILSQAYKEAKQSNKE